MQGEANHISSSVTSQKGFFCYHFCGGLIDNLLLDIKTSVYTGAWTYGQISIYLK